MKSLSKGHYTGEAIRQYALDTNLVTVTQYSEKKNLPEWHCHDSIHFCLVFDRGRADTRSSENYADPAGSVFAYHSGEMHRWLSPDSHTNAINVALSSEFLANANLNETVVVNAIKANPVAKVGILRLYQALAQSRANTCEEAVGELLQLLSNPLAQSFRGMPGWIKYAYEFVLDNWERRFSLQDVARAAGVHYVTVATYFCRHVGLSPHQLQKRLRLAKAVGLMHTETWRFSDIAYDSGFADQSHLIRTLKRQTGFTPRQLRNFICGH